MSEIVFILGAGASAASGAPLMKDFLDKADELRRTSDLGRHKDDFDYVFDTISQLQVVHSKAELDLNNIESVYAAFEMGKLINTLANMNHLEIERLLVSLRKVIYVTLEKSMIYSLDKKKVLPTAGYHKFIPLVQSINEKSQFNRCSIITFNYDVALDNAFFFHQLFIDYGVNKLIEKRNIPLLKMHGSLNWVKCKDCGTILPWSIHDFLTTCGSTFIQGSSCHLRIATCINTSNLEHCNKIADSDPVIVPPTWNKTQYHTGLTNVWSHAARELSEAENIFVIGYSLNETDSFFRYLFALGSVGQARLKRFWVFDPDKDVVEKRYRDMIGPAVRDRFQYIPFTFDQAIGVIRSEKI